MPHNQVASVVSLAKALKLDLAGRATITVPRETMELLLNTLIELADTGNPTAVRVQAAASAMVGSRVHGVEGR